jgi:DnaJ-domain-containing protein 1
MTLKAGGMEKRIMRSEERNKLRRREAELLQRIERLKKAMNETKELTTLASKGKLFKEAQDELRRIQEKLAGIEE